MTANRKSIITTGLVVAAPAAIPLSFQQVRIRTLEKKTWSLAKRNEGPLVIQNSSGLTSALASPRRDISAKPLPASNAESICGYGNGRRIPLGPGIFARPSFSDKA